jgi:Tfp pilus assembly protein PilW
MYHNKLYCGFTLIELLIVSVISMGIFGALTTIYLTTEKNYQAQIALTSIEENAQYTLHFLEKSLHMAGNIGCAKLTKDFPIKHLSSYDFSASNKISGTGALLTIRGMNQLTAGLIAPIRDPTVLYVNSSPHFSPGDIVMISSCKSAEIFKIKQVSIVNDATQRIVSTEPIHQHYSLSAEVGLLEENSYFVNRTGRFDSKRVPISAFYVKNIHQHKMELAEGIEKLKFNCEVETNGLRKLISPEQVSDWTQVIGIQVSFQSVALNGYPLKKMWYRYFSLQ